MQKNTSLIIAALAATVVVLLIVVLWQNGARDCEKRLGPMLETRYLPFKGCLVRIGDEWRSEEEIKNSVEEGVKQIEEGGKKVIEGIFGKQPPSKR